MPVITDKEFGTITLRRSSKATSVKIRVAPNGNLRASLPVYAPTFFVKRLINSSRSQLRELLKEHHKGTIQFVDGMQVGKSHTLRVQPTSGKTKVSRHGQQIVVSLAEDALLNDTAVADAIRQVVITALRIEAKSYLPKRLAFLANKHGYTYRSIRFSHAGGRWGSCSSSGTISLNIALMKLPFELIDYVLIHELSHTKQLNHGSGFWKLVANADPGYVIHQQMLKDMSPSV